MTPKKDTNGNDDTIVAVITPPGEGGIAALRIADEFGCDTIGIQYQHPVIFCHFNPQVFLLFRIKDIGI